MDLDVAHSPIDNSAESLLHLHELVVAGDRTAWSRLANEHYDTLLQRTRAGLDVRDPDMVYTAVNDALMGYLYHPERYNPEKLSLLAYLVMSARGDLKNALKSRQRRDERELPPLERVADDGDEAELEIEVAASDDVEAEVLGMLSDVPAILDDLFPDPTDRQIADMILDGIRETSAYSDLLGLGHLSAQEQADEVKRCKDRIKKKLQRWGKSRRGAIYDD